MRDVINRSAVEDRLTGDATMDIAIWDEQRLVRNDFVIIFAVITTATIVVALIRAFLFFSLCMKSSIRLHDNMFESISRSPMNFFHSNPSGRVLNRFSKDMGAIDELLPQAMIDCFQIMLNLVGVITVILLIDIALLIPIVSALIIFYILRVIYIRTTGAVKRLEGIKFEGSSIGLAITQCISLTGIFQWGMRQSAEMENQMTSVERVLEYTKLPREAALKSEPNKKPPPDWPSQGHIDFENLSLKYSPDGNLVLHNLQFSILPKEKEPVLFSGTMRKNLDPFDEYPDEVLINALKSVELQGEGESVGVLYKDVSEGGSNFSVGERQLVCLARAIVHNDRILVLDEATANVDAQTDSLIQNTIREHFKECTVLTIAHRLNTVIDSNKILVLDAGRLVEFDHPHILLQNKRGQFRKMVQETGPSMSNLLHKLAAQNYKKSKI